MIRIIKELLKPNGMYSFRRLTGMVGLFWFSVTMGIYLITPDRIDIQVVVIAAGVAGIGAGAAAINNGIKIQDEKYQ
jgi:hypothetical protein